MIITLNLRQELVKTPSWKRSKTAVRLLRNLLKRRLRSDKIKLSKKLNEAVWHRGIKNPPTKLRLKVMKEGEFFKVELLS